VFVGTLVICKLLAVMNENCDPIEAVGACVAEDWKMVEDATVIVDPELLASELLTTVGREDAGWDDENGFGMEMGGRSPLLL